MTIAYTSFLYFRHLIIWQHLIFNIFRYIILHLLLSIRVILFHLIHISLTHPVLFELPIKYAAICQPYLPLPLPLRLLHLSGIDLAPDHISVSLE